MAESQTDPLEPPKIQMTVTPLNAIHVADVGHGAAIFDDWLRHASDGRVTLERLQGVAGTITVAGDSIALIDALNDLVLLASYQDIDPVVWTALGINLIALLPEPSDSVAARMSLRPVLFLALQELRENSAKTVDNALVTTLAAHLNSTIAGELDDFINQAQSQVPDLLEQATQLGVALLQELSSGLQNAADLPTDAPLVLPAAQPLLHDPRTTLPNIFQAAWNAYHWGGADVANPDTGPGASLADAKRQLSASAATLQTLSTALPARLLSLAGAQITSLLSMLEQAIKRWRESSASQQSANIRPSVTNQAIKVGSDAQLGALGNWAEVRGDVNFCKSQPAPAGTAGSISFARGTERITHTDFALPGPFPLNLTRLYRSSLTAYDEGLFGARWVTAYTTRFDLIYDTLGAEGLRYHATDGRSHDYPLPKPDKMHYDPVEGITLVRTSAEELVLAYGYGRWEHYQSAGQGFRLSRIRLQNGARLELHYEHRIAERAVLSDLISYQDDALHTHLGTQLDAQGRIIGLWQIADGQLKRLLSRYQYDEAGDLIKAHDEHAASWRYTYQAHLISRYTDRTGRGMNLHWQGSGPDAKVVREWADDSSFDTQLEWDSRRRVTYVTDAHGQLSSHYYDILGYTYRIRHADGRSEWFYRDAAKNVVRHVRPDGRVDRYAYDQRSNLLEHIRADSSTVHYAYDDKDQLFKIRDAEGGLWKRDYDQRGNLIETIDPLGNKTEYAYDSAGHLVKATDANGGQTLIAYNADGQMTQYTDCSGKCSKWDYNELGQLSRFTDAVGNSTDYIHSAGHLSKLILPDKTEENFVHDAEGRLLKHIDALGQHTNWEYTAAGLITLRTDTMGHTLAYGWDKLGQLITLTNENGRCARFEYDSAGRLLCSVGFDQTSTTYRYAGVTGILAGTETATQVMTVAFDAMGRLIERRAHVRSSANINVVDHDLWQSERYAYDSNGRLLLAQNSDIRLQWFYDAAGNLVREHQHYLVLKNQKVAVWLHEYDVMNQRCATVRPDGQREEWLSYGSGHIHGVLFNARELVSVERDDLHREVRREQGNQLVQTQAWNPVGQLSEQSLMRTPGTSGGESVADRNHVGQRLAHRRYGYDAAGQLRDIHDSYLGARSYQYDPVGRLLEASNALGKETFAFDPASNLLDPSVTRPNIPQEHYEGNPVYTYRQQPRSALPDNVLREYAGTRYYYDSRGNLIEKYQNGASHSRYKWDNFNRLIGYEDSRLQVQYYYDALDRRQVKYSQALYRQHRGAGEQWNRQQQAQLNQQYDCGLTLYGWDGNTLAWESRGEKTTHYLYEPGSFVPLAQAVIPKAVALHEQPIYSGHYDIDQDPLWAERPKYESNLAIAWYQCDHLGTPQELTDEQGELAWRGKYKAWGAAEEIISETAQAVGICNPLRFQGQYFDSETGLHYNRHRYYDPHCGRYLSKDPIGLMGGMNFHTYVGNPIQSTDALGLSGNAHQRRVADRRALRSAIPTDGNLVPIQNPIHTTAGSYYGIDRVHDQVNPNKKIWEALSPHSYKRVCDKWEYPNPLKVCNKWDEKPGWITGKASDSIPATSQSIPLPAGYKCLKTSWADDVHGPTPPPTAGIDDVAELILRGRAQRGAGVRK